MTFPTPKKFQTLVLKWFDQYGRKTLPWQQNKTPYRVWVSEIMLQQTQVSTVIPYYERFLKAFPDLKSLANAPEDEVLHHWTGLGYYSRARNLHRSAKMIMATFDGKFPHTLDELQTLPGIGRSTAGAILALAFNQPAAILDGNVKRVLTRLHGITEWSGEKHTAEKLWQLAQLYAPVARIADYTQAMMDIGATLCVRGQPKCCDCPFQTCCIAHLDGIEKQLPKKKPSRIIPVRTATLLILQTTSDVVLLEKRPRTGIWGGLWSLPEIPGIAASAEIRAVCRDRFRVTPMNIVMGKSFRHTFSHFHLDILPVSVTVKVPRAKTMEANQQIWYNLRQPDAIGLPAPVKTLLQSLVIEEPA